MFPPSALPVNSSKMHFSWPFRRRRRRRRTGRRRRKYVSKRGKEGKWREEGEKKKEK